MNEYTVLGIETSCDETAVAVYRTSQGVLSSVLLSQVPLHAPYGGVVPELQSRAHLEHINTVISQALDAANHSLNDIDVIAVTTTPGLAGSLLVGLCYAKAIAYTLDKKLIAVNHIEGHAFSAQIENNIPFPYLCLTASGGHTALHLIKGFGDYTLIGQTVDDAAGEAFDKVGKMMGLPYPGGPIIENLAAEVGFEDFFEYPRLRKKGLDMSFSGLKTAVLYDLIAKKAYDPATKKWVPTAQEHVLRQQVASSLLCAVADIFESRISQALLEYPTITAIAFAGGVAANRYLTTRLANHAATHGRPFFSPSRQYCTDNGAMIAFVGHYRAQQGKFADMTLDIG